MLLDTLTVQIMRGGSEWKKASWFVVWRLWHGSFIGLLGQYRVTLIDADLTLFLATGPDVMS